MLNSPDSTISYVVKFNLISSCVSFLSYFTSRESAEPLDDPRPPLHVGDQVDYHPDVSNCNVETSRLLAGDRVQIRKAARGQAYASSAPN